MVAPSAAQQDVWIYGPGARDEGLAPAGRVRGSVLLQSKSVKELNSDATGLRQELMEVLSKAFFAGEQPLAKVTDLTWVEYLVQ